MIRPLSFVAVPSLLILVALSSPGCDDDELEGESWSHSMTGDEVSVSAHPTMTSGKAVIDTPWYAEVSAHKHPSGALLTIQLSNSESVGFSGSPGRIRLQVRGKLGAQTFTTFRTTGYYSSASSEAEGLEIGIEDRNGDESTRGEGTVVFEDLTFEHRGEESAHFHARVKFENVRLWTAGKDPLGNPKEYESTLSETLDVTADDKPSPPSPSSSSGGSSSGGSSSGGSSSSGGANCGTSVWTCAYDGQATPTCQYACTFPAGSNERKQSCDVLRSMLESGNTATCCGSICP